MTMIQWKIVVDPEYFMAFIDAIGSVMTDGFDSNIRRQIENRFENIWGDISYEDEDDVIDDPYPEFFYSIVRKVGNESGRIMIKVSCDDSHDYYIIIEGPVNIVQPLKKAAQQADSEGTPLRGAPDL